MSDERKAKHTPIVSIVGDGETIELILDPVGKRTSLLRCCDGELTAMDTLDLADQEVGVPVSARNNLIVHEVVLLPSAAAEYGSTDSLLREVRSFIHRYADLSEQFEEVAALYVLLSWVYDRYTVVPYLRLKGDYGTGKTRCLQVVGSITYKPMFVSGASTVSPVFRIIDAFRGTLILDESDFRFSDEKAEIIKILNNGNAAGFPVLRSDPTPQKDFNPRAFAVFGPKIIATRRDFEDQALESRCITEVMTGLPPRRDIPLSLPASFADEARELRNKLLLYRFRERWNSVDLGNDREQALEARIAQVFAPLLSIALDDSSRERIRTLAAQQATSLHAERESSVESLLLDTLYVMRHEGAALTVRDISRRFAERFGNDFDRPVTARWVGSLLRRRLSLLTLKRHGNYVIPESELPKLEKLFERYQITDDRVDLGTSGTF